MVVVVAGRGRGPIREDNYLRVNASLGARLPVQWPI